MNKKELAAFEEKMEAEAAARKEAQAKRDNKAALQAEVLTLDNMNEDQLAEYNERQAKFEAGRVESETKLAKMRRAERFRTEADPLFFKVQRGEATQAEYDSLVAEIRAAFPYPEEV